MQSLVSSRMLVFILRCIDRNRRIFCAYLRFQIALRCRRLSPAGFEHVDTRSIFAFSMLNPLLFCIVCATISTGQTNDHQKETNMKTTKTRPAWAKSLTSAQWNHLKQARQRPTLKGLFEDIAFQSRNGCRCLECDSILSRIKSGQ